MALLKTPGGLGAKHSFRGQRTKSVVFSLAQGGRNVYVCVCVRVCVCVHGPPEDPGRAGCEALFSGPTDEVCCFFLGSRRDPPSSFSSLLEKKNEQKEKRISSDISIRKKVLAYKALISSGKSSPFWGLPSDGEVFSAPIGQVLAILGVTIGW